MNDGMSGMSRFGRTGGGDVKVGIVVEEGCELEAKAMLKVRLE